MATTPSLRAIESIDAQDFYFLFASRRKGAQAKATTLVLGIVDRNKRTSFIDMKSGSLNGYLPDEPLICFLRWSLTHPSVDERNHIELVRFGCAERPT
jgi:hypothetical protein